MRTLRSSLAVALAAIALASCAGHEGVLPHAFSNPERGKSRTSLQIKIKVPKSSASTARRRMYISPATQSITVAIDNGAPQAYGITPNSPGCIPASGNTPLTCTISLSIDSGNQTGTFKTYDAANGTGDLLSSNVNVPIDVLPGQANQLGLTLEGVINSIVLTLATTTPPGGIPTTIPLSVNTYDAANDLIVGPGSYSNGPVTLADSDTSGATTLSASSVTDPSVAITVKYNGAAVPGGSATFSAGAGAIQTSNSQDAVLTPSIGNGGTPASGIVSNYVPIHAYMGFASGGCEGGQPASVVIQSVMRYVQSCGTFDPTTVCPQAQAPPSGAFGCNGEYYVSTIGVYCTTTAETKWLQQESANEGAFLHTSSPPSPTNRLASTDPRAKCPAPGQTTPSDYFYWANPSDSSSITYWLTNWFQASPIQSRTYVYAFLDNIEWGRPFAGASPVEYSSIQSWRQALGAYSSSFTNGTVPYELEENMLGPGGGNYGHNNASGSGEGVVNEAVDVTDVCDSDAGASNISGYTSERPWEGQSGVRLLTGGNPKILINAVSQFWADPNCKGNIEQLNAADTITLRMVTKALDFIMTKPGSQGSPQGQAIAEFRYSIGVTLGTGDAASEVPVFPEDLLVMVNPITPLGKWHWSGLYDGGGCANNGTKGQLAPDTGGTHDVTLARACGQVGNWDGGYPAPVYYREGTCYRQGVMVGACAAIINLGATAFALKSSDLTNGAYYREYLAPTGGELPTDPVTGGTLCGATNCTGAWGTQPLQGAPWSYNLPSCVPSSGDTGTYQNAYDCAIILLP